MHCGSGYGEAAMSGRPGSVVACFLGEITFGRQSILVSRWSGNFVVCSTSRSGVLDGMVCSLTGSSVSAENLLAVGTL